MVFYECKLCSFNTKRKTDYTRHCLTKKHKNLCNNGTSKCSQNASQTQSEISQGTIKCEYCNKCYSRKSSMSRHYKICSIKNDLIKQKDFELDQQKRLHQKDIEQKEMYKKELEYYREMLFAAGGMMQKTVSSITYAMTNYSNAPIIKKIKFSQIKKISNKNTTDFIEQVLYSYNNKILDEYIGDMIVKLYKKKDINNQSIWNTDSSRLTYLLKQIIYGEESKWIVDKKGINTINYIITPIMDEIKQLIQCYQEEYCVNNPINDINKIEYINTASINLVNEINTKKIHQKILKYISYHLQLKDTVLTID